MIVSRPKKPSLLLYTTQKKEGVVMAYRVCWAVHHEKSTQRTCIGQSRGSPRRRPKPQLRETIVWLRKGSNGCDWVKRDSDPPMAVACRTSYRITYKESHLPHLCLFHQRNEKNQGAQHDGSFAASTVSDSN